MNPANNKVAFGAPGIEPRWTRSAKEGIGTAYHTSCRVWFTLSHGIINEIYYPNVDCPNTRDLQFLITDGETFCHEERRDLVHQIEYPEKSTLYYRLTNSDPEGRYRIIKEVITDPHLSVFLMSVRVEIMDRRRSGGRSSWSIRTTRSHTTCTRPRNRGIAGCARCRRACRGSRRDRRCPNSGSRWASRFSQSKLGCCNSATS